MTEKSYRIGDIDSFVVVYICCVHTRQSFAGREQILQNVHSVGYVYSHVLVSIASRKCTLLYSLRIEVDVHLTARRGNKVLETIAVNITGEVEAAWIGRMRDVLRPDSVIEA